MEKSLSKKEKELEKTKRDLNKFYKLYLEHKNKKIDETDLNKYSNIEKRNKELIDEKTRTKKDLSEKDSILKEISEQNANSLNKIKDLENQKVIMSQKIKEL